MKFFVASLMFLVFVSLPCNANPTNIPAYAKFEASFTVSGQTGNPFDPLQNDIDVAFRNERGNTVIVPAFWDGDRWRVRFAPEHVGTYTLRVLRSGAAIPTPADLTASTFHCVRSGDPGFIRVDKKSPQHFVFDNGEAYYPQGIDVAWSGGNVPAYPEMIGKLGAAHMNWARVWMTFWDNKALEWASDKSKNPPIGQYSLDAARRWDSKSAS